MSRIEIVMANGDRLFPKPNAGPFDAKVASESWNDLFATASGVNFEDQHGTHYSVNVNQIVYVRNRDDAEDGESREARQEEG